jgi:hypothetical protein
LVSRRFGPLPGALLQEIDAIADRERLHLAFEPSAPAS